jgi:hypothetical protein
MSARTRQRVASYPGSQSVEAHSTLAHWKTMNDQAGAGRSLTFISGVLPACPFASVRNEVGDYSSDLESRNRPRARSERIDFHA